MIEIEELFFLRHGARLDQQDFRWRSTAAAPYDTPLSARGVHQARRTGVEIARRSQSQTLRGERRGEQSGEQRGGRRGGRMWVIHTSPFLRCVQTSLAVAQGLLDELADAPSDPVQGGDATTSAVGGDFGDGATDSNAADSAQRCKHRVKLRIDCGLGEWLTPDYYQDIQPPPPMPELVHSARYYLRQVLARDLSSADGSAASQVGGHSEVGGGGIGNDQSPAVLSDRHDDIEQLTARYVDIDWDYDSQQLGVGGEYGEEWPEMHDRFRRSLKKLLFSGAAAVQDASLADSTQRARQADGAQVARPEDGHTAILVTHGAGCNALIGAVSGRPVLQDVGLCALSHAVLKQVSSMPMSPTAGGVTKVSDRYELLLAGDTDHLSSRPSSASVTPNPNAFSRSNSRRSLQSLVAVGDRASSSNDRLSWANGINGASSSNGGGSGGGGGSEAYGAGGVDGAGTSTADSTAPNSPDAASASAQGFASWNLHRTHSLARERERKTGLWQRPASSDSLKNRSASVM